MCALTKAGAFISVLAVNGRRRFPSLLSIKENICFGWQKQRLHMQKWKNPAGAALAAAC